MKIQRLKVLFISVILCGSGYAQSTSATLIKKVEGFSHSESVVFNYDKNEYYMAD